MKTRFVVPARSTRPEGLRGPWTRLASLTAAIVFAMLPRPSLGRVDNLVTVLDARSIIGTKTFGSYGYDPTQDRMFLIAYGGDLSVPGNPGIVRISNVSTSPTSDVMLSQTQLQLYYTDGNPNLASPPTPGGLLLNPKPIGATPAFGLAMITDGEVTRLSSGSAAPSLSRRVYSYDLQSPPPGGDGRAVLTTRVTLADMQATAGSTSSSSFVQRQPAWSGDGQSIYFVDSSGGYGGLWNVSAVSGTARQILAADDTLAEPGVRSAGGIDTIFLSGGGSSGNAGGIDFVTFNGTTTSSRQIAVPTAKLLDFFEVSGTMPSQRVQSLTTVGDDLYFAFFTNANSSKPESRYPGIYHYDAEGRLSKVVNRTQRAAAFGSVNTVFDRLQSRVVAVTGTSGTFSATQILYRENAVNTVAGATAFKPVDFNRDNAVTAADLALLAPEVTVRGQVQTDVTNLRFDMNGNDTIDWKDVQIVEGFLDYVPDPDLAGRIVPTLPIQADTDLNGVVDFADFQVMQANFDTTSRAFTQGDFNGDNQVSFPDLQPWINSYGFRSAVVGGGVPMAPFDQVAWDQFLATLTSPAITLDVATGRQTQFQLGYRTIVIAAAVTKTGTGTLVYDAANTYVGTTAVAAGTLEIAAPAAVATSMLRVTAGATARVAAGTATTVAGLDLSAGGLVDLTTGAMTVTSGLSAAELVAEILVGRGDGSWTGAAGITSSAVAAEVAGGTPRAIGWLDHGDGGVSFAFSAPGDTNVDGVVDVLDAANFLAGGAFDAGTPASWFEGDFSYDGVVDILDAADFFSTGLYDTGSYLPRASGLAIAVVPEPATALMAATALALLACRRAARTTHPRSRIRLRGA